MKTSFYIPDDMYEQVRELNINVSALVRDAISKEIGQRTSRCTRCGAPVESSGDKIVYTPPVVDKDTSDGHHTFKELYRYRLLYNAALFNEWAKQGRFDVHKSYLHHDGTIPFEDPKWFIVVAELPTGQISNHYRVATDWDLFDIPTKRVCNVYDGHTPAAVAERLEEFLLRGGI